MVRNEHVNSTQFHHAVDTGHLNTHANRTRYTGGQARPAAQTPAPFFSVKPCINETQQNIAQEKRVTSQQLST